MISEERLDDLARTVAFKSDGDSHTIYLLIEEIRRLKQEMNLAVSNAGKDLIEENKRLRTFISDIAPSWLPQKILKRRREILK